MTGSKRKPAGVAAPAGPREAEKGIQQMKYSTIRKIWKQVALIIAVAAVLAVAGIRAIDGYLDRNAWERAADAVYPMADAHIEWTGAGYRGR